MRTPLAAALLILLSATAAMAQERDLCANRPGRGSPPCVLDAGRVQVETSLVDFTHDSHVGTTEDDTLVGDLALRIGVTGTGEAEFGFSPYVHTRTKDASGVDRQTGDCDLTLACRQSLMNPDGSGVSVALQPFVTAPVGKRRFRAGGWQGGLVMPMSFALADGFSLALTPQVAAVRNAANDGSHLELTGVIGLSHALGPFSVGAEVYIDQDNDPAGHATQETFDLSGAWIPPRMKDTQFDLGVNAGLNHNAPDYEVYAGIAHRF